MKVLLLTQKFSKVDMRWMPLGICYLAGYLREHGHSVVIFDRFAGDRQFGTEWMEKEMQRVIAEFQPDYIGMNAVSPYIFDVVETVKSIRRKYSGKIVLGGHHPTAMPRLTLERIPEVDAVFCGEGERGLCMFVEGRDYQEIPGLAWMEDGIFYQNPTDQIVNLDELPMPATDLLDLDFYTFRNAWVIREFYLSVGTMMISRGCKNRCSFCTETLTYSKGVRYHSPEYALNWMGTLLDQAHIDGITFLDSDFLADRGIIESICKGIIARGYHKRMVFCIQTRANHLDREIVDLLYAAGCRKMELGVETIKQGSLKSIAKNISIETMEEAIRICHEKGIRIQANLIRGMEDETLDDLMATIQWMKSMPLDNFSWGLLMLLPGSRLYREKGKRFFEESAWSEENVRAYYRMDHLSKTEQREIDSIFMPALHRYRKLSHHRNFLRNNALPRAAQYYWERVRQRLSAQ